MTVKMNRSRVGIVIEWGYYKPRGIRSSVKELTPRLGVVRIRLINVVVQLGVVITTL